MKSINTIIDIIKADKENFENCKLILNPMTNIHEVRRYLYANGFDIEKEKLVKEDGKLYTIMVAQSGICVENPGIQYEYIGIKLIENNDPLLPELFERCINKLNIAIDNMSYAHGDTKIKEFKNTKDRLVTLYHDYCS